MGGLRFGVIRRYWVWFDWIGFGSWWRYVLYWVQLNDCLDISFKLPNCENLVSNEKKTRHDYLHLFPGISHQPRQPDPRAEQMERRTVAHSHLLGYSMIHMATDDGYSTLSHSGQHQTHTHTDGWRGECQPVSGQHGASDMPHCLRPQSWISYQGQMWGCHSRWEPSLTPLSSLNSHIASDQLWVRGNLLIIHISLEVL